MTTKYALIVAGGSGSRMDADMPKQFICINHMPILMHTIIQFYQFDNNIKIVLVLPKNQFSYWKELCIKYNFELSHSLIEGGKTRFQSVKNGLDTIDEVGAIAIHDGVRPFVTNDIISKNFIVDQKKGSALTVVDLKDSIRLENNVNSKALIRNDYKQVQTPQTFNISQIKEAYKQAECSSFTDDASVFEANGGVINLVEGDYKNIKITTPEDLLIAEVYSNL